MRKCTRGIRCFFVSCCFVAVLCFQPNQSFAQNSRPLVEILKAIQNAHNVTFSYNPRLLSGIRAPETTMPDKLEDILNLLGTSLPLKFERAGKESILIIPIRSTLEFRVSDANDQSPIDLVYVAVNGTKQRHLIAQGGVFSLPNTFITDSLSISSSFYHMEKTSVQQIESNNNIILLKPEINDLGEVKVLSYLTSGVNSKLSDHSMEVDMSELGLIAGETDGDVLQVLQAIPGIRSVNGKPGSLNLRGSPFDQNLIYFDGIPIYHKGHFFGTISPYNPGIVDRISVHKGVLPAKYGGRVGGLINIETGDEVLNDASYGALANTLFTGLEFKVPVVEKRLSLTVSARTSYQPFGGLSPKLRAYYDLNFQGSRISPEITDSGNNLALLDIGFSDLNGKLIYNVGTNHKASFSFLSITNDFAYHFNGPNQNILNTEKTDLNNWGMTGQWTSQLSEKLSLNFSLTRSSLDINENQSEFQSNVLSETETIKNTLEDTRFFFSLDYKISKQSKVNFGYESTHHDLTIRQRDAQGPGPQNRAQRKSSADISSLFINLEQRIGDRLIGNLGLRSDAYSERSQNFLDPRITLTYLASKSFFVKASAGSAHQYIKQSLANDFDDFRVSSQFWTLAENNIPVIAATQWMVGGMFDKSSWLVDLELYKKHINNVSRPGSPQNPDQFGDLNIWGADLLIKKRWRNLETWLSYSLGQTRESIQQEQDAFNDQRHVLNIKTIIPIKRWNLAFSWGLMSGVPVYLPDPNEINGPAQNIANLYSGRFPTQHQLDLSATYQFSKPENRWRGVIGFSILNVYDQNNVINIFQQNVNANNPVRDGLGFSPNIQIKVSF